MVADSPLSLSEAYRPTEPLRKEKPVLTYHSGSVHRPEMTEKHLTGLAVVSLLIKLMVDVV